jgi:hypothetical protein
LSVLAHETAEEIASVDLGRLGHASQRRSDGWLRRLQPERPVRLVAVVVPDVDAKHLLEAAAAEGQ